MRVLAALVVLLAAAPAAARADAVVVAAGDIACDPAGPGFNGGLGTFGGPDAVCHEKYTSDLFAALQPAAVLPLGDTQYGNPGLDAYRASYDARDGGGAPISWGRAKAITHPVPGNHEYGDRDPVTGALTGAAGYFDYFDGPGNADGPAGPRDRGYYSFDLTVGRRADGSPVLWHLVALNSQCASDPDMAAATGWLGGCAAGSPQERWLRADLAAASAAGVDCTLAYWHHPRFSAAGSGDNDAVAPLYQALLDNDVDVLLSGHHHVYQRFGALDADGNPAPGLGVREFVVGTGGRELGPLLERHRTPEAIDNTTFGVLALTLGDGTYAWRFVPDNRSGTFTDAGSDRCVRQHAALVAAPAGPVASATFEFAGSRGPTSFACRMDDGPWTPCASPATYPALPDGAHTFAVRTVDASGAETSAATTRTFTVDRTPPAIAVTAPAAGAVLTGDVAPAATASDASGVARVDWTLDGVPLGSSAAAPWSIPWSTTRSRDDAHRLVATATDAAGNVAAAAVGVIVRNRPPVASLPVGVGAVPQLDGVTTLASRRLRALRRDGLRLRLQCTLACRVDARLTVPAALARRLGVRPQLARGADRRFRTLRPRLVLRPARRTRARLGRVHVLRATLVIALTDRAGHRITLRRTVVLR